MFGRKKKKEKKHKPGTTDAELSKLDEVAARRGFFGAKKASKHEPGAKKEEKSLAPVPSGNTQLPSHSTGDGDQERNGKTEADDQRSVLEKAALYGDLISRNKSASKQPLPVPTRRLRTAADTDDRPVPPSRKKSSKHGSGHEPSPQTLKKLPPLGSSLEYLQSHGSSDSFSNVASSRNPLPTADQGYSVTTPWITAPGSTKPVLNETQYDYPNSPPKVSPMFSPSKSTKTVVLRKRESGDFGISLRRSSIIEHSTSGSTKRTVYFAEPGSAMEASGESIPLAKGDRLIAINDYNVEDYSRDDIIGLIKSAKDQIAITVQSIPEITEPSPQHRSMDEAIDSMPAQREERRKNSATKVRDDNSPKVPLPAPLPVAQRQVKERVPLPVVTTGANQPPAFDESQWEKGDKVWCSQKEGFLLANILKFNGNEEQSGINEGKVRVKLENSADVIIVDEECVEKVNPDELDRSENFSSLRFLNESGVLNVLHQRYNGGLSHTYAGPHLVSVQLDKSQSTMGPEVFKGGRQAALPPHVLSVAQEAYAEMLATGNDQSVLFTGYSGAGKTTQLRSALKYLATIGGSHSSQVSVEKLSAVSDILDSFSSAKSPFCDSSSRCANVYTLGFDRSGQLGTVAVQCMIFDSYRTVRRPKSGGNFKIFYELVEGADSQTSRELFITKEEQKENPFLFASDFQMDESDGRITEMDASFKKLKSAMETIRFSLDEMKVVFSLIAACLHLQTAGSQKVGSGRYQFLKPDAAQKAASLLGFSIENLAKMIFQPSSSSRPVASPTPPRSAGLQRTMSNSSMMSDSSDSSYSGHDNLEGFIVGLYTEAFRLAMSIINRSLSTSNFNTKSSLLVVDSPGVQGFGQSDEGQTQPFATLEDLFFNYTQEKLQLLYHHNAFTRLYDRYQQENVSCDFELFEGDANAVVDAMDRPPGQSRTGGSSNLLTDAKGLFWLLDEEALISGASEESFIERLNMFYGNPKKDRRPIMKKGHKRNHFFINHMMGTCQVEYDATDWLKFCRDHPFTKAVGDMLQDSKKNHISTLIGGRTSSGSFSGSVVGLDNAGRSLTLRRGPSMKRVWTTSMTTVNVAVATKKKSLPMIKKLQVNSLIDALQRTHIHFVHCVNPCRSTVKDRINSKLVRDQVKGFEIVPATRVYKQGYPEHMVFLEFRRCYDVLCKQLGAQNDSNAKTSLLSHEMDNKEATEIILKTCDVEPSHYRLGISQVLFRAGVLAQLEKRRNEKISTILTTIQAHCRGYLARRYVAKRKVQVVAIRCIQRNIRKFLVVRQWPWWRLLTKVLPLVEVHRTEEDLREREAELEILKARLDKVSAERDELKKDNERFETQFNDVIGELSEERQTASHASEMLEQETRERMTLEKQLEEIQSQTRHFRQKCESMEVELAERRLLHSNKRDSLFDSSDEEEDVSEYRMKFEMQKREMEYKHKKEIQDLEEKLEEAQANKKHVDKKFHVLEEEFDEQERIANQNKKKAQRTLAELNDTKVHLEDTNAKLHEIEKKQRKFDSEMYAVQAELTEVKLAKDKLQREKDSLSVEIYTKRNELEENSGDIEVLKRKIERLEEELDETATKDSEDGHMLNSLKKQRRELEAKVKDQEEELDEQAGQIQMLEQAKERLEMTAERTRQQHSKEMETKDDDFEEMRSSYQKKVKNLESQLEEEEDERAAVTKQKRDLEQQLAEFRNNQPLARRDAEAERRLRKDVKRYKALLDDAQTLIDHLKADAVNKQQLKQIRVKLEESEYSCANAVKAKKSIELELEDVQSQLEEISKAKQESETKVSQLQRENHHLNSKLEEDADDTEELTKKYKNLLSKQSEERKEIVELNSQIDDYKREKELLNEKILTMQSQLEYVLENTTDKSNVTRLDSKVRDLETRLDFEKTTTRRLEVQLGRLKENVEKLQSERDAQAASEHREKEQCKRLQKQLRDAKDEQADIIKREQEARQRQRELESEVLEHVSQTESLQADLKLAFKRISDLQIAFEEFEDSDAEDFSGSEAFDSDSDDDRATSSYRRSNYSTYRSGLRSASGISSRHSLTSDDDIPSYRFRKYSSDDSLSSADKEPKPSAARVKYDSSDGESDV